MGGHLEVLQWARQHNCPWDAATYRSAPRGGHLAVLMWAREHECPLDEMKNALRHRGWALGGIEVGAGAPLPAGRRRAHQAASSGHLEVLQWARDPAAAPKVRRTSRKNSYRLGIYACARPERN